MHPRNARPILVDFYFICVCIRSCCFLIKHYWKSSNTNRENFVGLRRNLCFSISRCCYIYLCTTIPIPDGLLTKYYF